MVYTHIYTHICVYVHVCLVAQSCLTLCDPIDCSPPGSLSVRFPRQEYWSGLPFPCPNICESVQFSRLAVSTSLWPHESQHTRPPCPSPTPGVQTHVHRVSDAIQPSHPLSSPSPLAPNPSQHQSLFQWVNSSHWGGQSTGVSPLASVPPKNNQDWSPLGWTGWISLQSKGLSRVFSNTTVQKHQFFGSHLSSQSNSHIHTWPLEKP